MLENMKGVKISILFRAVLMTASVVFTASCEILDDDIEKHGSSADSAIVELGMVARILSEIPLESEHLQEVHVAVQASSENGYDEEYMMKDLFDAPGSGVGDEEEGTRGRSGQFANPLCNLIERYVRESVPTRSGKCDISDPDAFLDLLKTSDIQIYWPFSELWDGKGIPIVSFDPEDGADVNIGYRLKVGDDGTRHVEEVLVDEEMAREVPVWIVNRNSDAEHTSLELLRREDPSWGEGGGTIIVKPGTKSGSVPVKSLILRDFTMNRHYDSWFAGASEFFVKVGFVDDFTASTEAELKMYNPRITDFMVVVRRGQLGKPQPFNTLLISDWNEQMSHCAFMITEDDGGTRSEWKCTALVRVQSKSYGIELNLPFNSRDDIVWRGQLAQRWLNSNSGIVGNFGDVDLTFEVVEY